MQIEFRRRLRHAILPMLGVAMTGYFGYHALTGDRSLLAYFRITDEIKAAKAELAQVQAERKKLEHRVSLLRPESLDPDMLDERARWSLGFVGDREIVILDPSKVAQGRPAPPAN
jgi:cell division protein FtsB